ncbi:MAG: M36 family metallopeptidase [Archangium sp.]|nr:M36 family metallopeptidase [Archangium sp.]MDP3575539.1 M36 family metallopeptidase [Archangium sp.]
MINVRNVCIGAVIFSGLLGCGNAVEAPSNLRISATQPGQTLSAASRGSSLQVLADYLGRTTTGLRLEQSSVSADGVKHVRVVQELGGVRVVGATARAAQLPSGELVHVIDTLVPDQVVAPSTLPASDALRLALAHHGYAASTLVQRALTGNVTTFEPTAELFSAPTVERVAFVDAAGRVQSGFEVETWSLVKNMLHHTLLDGAGQVVSVELRTNSDAYNVFIEDPSKGGQTVVQGPGAGNAESPSGWLAGAQLNTNAVGNNVNAYLDADGNNRPDRGGTSIVNGQFLTAADLTQAPGTTSNRAVAVQNLFYLNNVVHDVLYRHGFNEAAGNFQTDNFGKGGAAGDAVLAEAQDGSGTDNANFATPADGSKPRMQMYLWTGSGATHEVVANGVTYDASSAEFGAALTTTGITGPLALVNDGVGVGADACEAIPTSLAGKVALVQRGTCAFIVKVKNAQTAGATAVIVMNDQGGDALLAMGGTDRKVRIPSVLVSQNTGAAIITAASATARKKAQQPLMIDGDLDSDIVFHEFGHGLSWRMIGGMSGKLAGAIGEGASDVVAFLIDGDDRIGEYAYGNVNGIRRAPYAGYPNTYSDVTGAEVHDDGEIYAAAMWRLHELFVANNVPNDTLLTLFVDGMNYTPATPAFEHMRDGMLQASSNRGGQHNCLIWKAFAQYGIGVGASGTDTSTGVTIVESFTVPAACQP